MLPRLYLAGGINKLSDADAKDWREYVKERIGEQGAMPLFECVDPMRRDYRGREGEPGIAAEIVHGDINDIDSCQAIILNASKPSWGTAWEGSYATCGPYARFSRKQVVAWGAGDAPSPWLAYHCTMANSIDQAVGLLIVQVHELFESVNG